MELEVNEYRHRRHPFPTLDEEDRKLREAGDKCRTNGHQFRSWMTECIDRNETRTIALSTSDESEICKR